VKKADLPNHETTRSSSFKMPRGGEGDCFFIDRNGGKRLVCRNPPKEKQGGGRLETGRKKKKNWSGEKKTAIGETKKWKKLGRRTNLCLRGSSVVGGGFPWEKPGFLKKKGLLTLAGRGLRV